MPEFLSQIASNASVEELGRMVRATAPVFLLSAVAAYISVLTTRLFSHCRSHPCPQPDFQTDHDRRFLRSDVPRMKRRAELIHRAIRFPSSPIGDFNLAHRRLHVRRRFRHPAARMGSGAAVRFRAGHVHLVARELRDGIAHQHVRLRQLQDFTASRRTDMKSVIAAAAPGLSLPRQPSDRASPKLNY